MGLLDDIKSAADQHEDQVEAVIDKAGDAVDQATELRAVLLRPARDPTDVVLVVLAEVGRVRTGNRALLPHPGDGNRGVETAGEGDADPLARWQ